MPAEGCQRSAAEQPTGTSQSANHVDRTSHTWSVLTRTGHPWPPCCGANKMKLLTVQEVADTMKVSEKTVRRLIKRGDLTAYKVGERGQLRVKESDLNQYVEAQRVDVEAGAETKLAGTGSGE